MRMVPLATIGRGGNESDRFVILPVDVLRLAILPWSHAVAARPSISVALALEADENGGRHVRVRLRVAPGLVLADEAVEHVVGHAWLNPQVAGRAPVIEIKLPVHDVRNEVRLAHGEPAQRIGLDLVLRLEEVCAAVEALREGNRTIEYPVRLAEDIHHVRRRRADEYEG